MATLYRPDTLRETALAHRLQIATLISDLSRFRFRGVMPFQMQALYLSHLMSDSAFGVADKEINFRNPLHLGASFQGRSKPSERSLGHLLLGSS